VTNDSLDSHHGLLTRALACTPLYSLSHKLTTIVPQFPLQSFPPHYITYFLLKPSAFLIPPSQLTLSHTQACTPLVRKIFHSPEITVTCESYDCSKLTRVRLVLYAFCIATNIVYSRATAQSCCLLSPFSQGFIRGPSGSVIANIPEGEPAK